MLSGSSVERAMLCPASCVLPQVQTTSAAAKRGTALHEFIADDLDIGREAALEKYKEKHPRSKLRLERAIDTRELRAILGDAVSAEVVIYYDTFADRSVIGLPVTDREYKPANEYVLPMTLDLVGRNGTTLVEVKTGTHQVSPPQWNWQIKTQSLGLARARKIPTIRAHLAQLVGEVFRIEEYEFDAFELDCIADDLRALKERTLAKSVDVNPSEEACHWCKARSACPAWSKKEPVQLVQIGGSK